jgi:hypothetical protein
MSKCVLPTWEMFSILKMYFDSWRAFFLATLILILLFHPESNHTIESDSSWTVWSGGTFLVDCRQVALNIISPFIYKAIKQQIKKIVPSGNCFLSYSTKVQIYWSFGLYTLMLLYTRYCVISDSLKHPVVQCHVLCSECEVWSKYLLCLKMLCWTFSLVPSNLYCSSALDLYL